jgi:N-acetylglucosamine-6-phosphate deacetylase
MNHGTEGSGSVGVRMITAAPEVEGVMEAIGALSKRGLVFSIGHRFISSPTTLTFDLMCGNDVQCC